MKKKKKTTKATDQTEMPKKISKLWQASEKYSGTGRFLDMQAVMK